MCQNIPYQCIYIFDFELVTEKKPTNFSLALFLSFSNICSSQSVWCNRPGYVNKVSTTSL